jgi:D-sedoheptulose 7-phosphate isomerase
MMKKHINDYLEKLKTTIDSLDRTELETFIEVLLTARERDNTIFIMGNGGSAATASHFCCDFNKGVGGFRFICLNDNIPTMMAYANDISYDDVFIEQLKNLYRAGDVVIGISGSGNSKNVLKAIEYANLMGATTVGLTGYDGGKLKQIARYSVNTNINDMQITEDLHMIFDHMVMSILCSSVAPVKTA